MLNNLTRFADALWWDWIAQESSLFVGGAKMTKSINSNVISPLTVSSRGTSPF